MKTREILRKKSNKTWEVKFHIKPIEILEQKNTF